MKKNAAFQNRYDVLLQNVSDNVEFIRKSKVNAKSGLENQYNNIIGINGKRGFGKSTLLLNVCRLLIQNSDIVIEPITPDEFRTNESFYAIVLFKLENELNGLKEECSKDQKLINNLNDLLEQLKILQLDQARASWAFFNNLKNSGLRGDDFSWQFSESQSRKLNMRNQFSDIIKKALEIKKTILLKKDQKSLNLLFVIPIDDCDTAPDLIPRFIDELEEISRSTETIIIVSFSTESMNRAIAFKFLNPIKDVMSNMLDSKITNYNNIQKEIRDLINKIFPLSHRVELPGWTNLNDRINFRSIHNPTYSILDSFKALIFEDNSPIRNISELFDLSNFISSNSEIRPSIYTNMLPISGRGLSNLQESINIILQSRNKSNRIEQNEIGFILKTICTSVVSEFSVSDYEIYENRIKWTNLNQLDIDFSDLTVDDIGIYSTRLGNFKNETCNKIKFPITESFDPTELILELDKLEQKNHSIQIRLMKDVHLFIKETEQKNTTELSSELSNILFFLMEWQDKYYNVYHLTSGGDFNPDRAIFANTITTDLDDDFEEGLSFFLFPAYGKPLIYNIIFEIWNNWAVTISNQVNSMTEEEKNRFYIDNNTSYTDLFGLLHLKLILSIQVEEKIEPSSLENILFIESQFLILNEKLKEDIISLVRLISKNELSQRKLIKSMSFNESLLNILIHLANNVIFSYDFTNWIRNEILLPFKEYLFKDLDPEQKFNGYFDYCIRYAKKSFSKQLIQNFSENFHFLDAKSFEKVFPVKFKKYVNNVRLFQPYTEDFLYQLIDKKFLDSKDLVILGEKGLVPQIRSKLSLLDSEQSEWIISELESLLPTESNTY